MEYIVSNLSEISGTLITPSHTTPTSRRSQLSIGSLDESFWRDKSVLVTGSSGFAGRNLCNLLSSADSRIRCFVRSKNDFSVKDPATSLVVGDVQDYQSML